MYQKTRQARSYRRFGNTAPRSYARAKVEENPIESAKQFGLMEAVASGKARVKGLSQAIAEEFLRATPRNLKSKWAKELARIRKNRKNPGEVDISAEEYMSEEFHGRPAEEVVEVTEHLSRKAAMVIMGDLEELSVLSQDGKSLTTISFTKRKPKACCDAKGHNIEIIGGDQKLKLPDDEADKELVSLGFCVSIVYITDKHHLEDSEGETVAYEHHFAEEWYKRQGYSGDRFFQFALRDGVVMEAGIKGLLPMLAYNTCEEKILLAGGKYTIEAEGIAN